MSVKVNEYTMIVFGEQSDEKCQKEDDDSDMKKLEKFRND
jgi:hypothetical protein